MNDIAFKPKMKMKFYLSETVVNFSLSSDLLVIWYDEVFKH